MSKRGPGDNRIPFPCGIIILMFLLVSSIGTVSLGYWLA